MTLDKKWIDTIEQAIDDDTWDAYDAVIQAEVQYYKTQLARLALPQVNWLLIKAMVWTETGGPSNPSWTSRPMQIGNPGDPALAVLQGGKEGSDLIMSSSLKEAIRMRRTDEPNINIQAGIAYLYTRMAQSEIRSVVDPVDRTIHSYTVVAGDSLDKISRKVGTTVDELRASNPGQTALIRPGQELTYHKAQHQRVIIAWRAFNATTIALRYNVGDPAYAEKLTYIVDTVIPKLKR